MTLRYVLISEGGSDRMLLDPINWLLEQHCCVGFSGEWANPSAMDDSSRQMEIRLAQARRYYPCDIAFVHRDADGAGSLARAEEIEHAAAASRYAAPLVCVVPVRMTEAWFLFSEPAIRRAAGNPSSHVALSLPNHAAVQRHADPKTLLEEKLVVASETSGRRLKQFRGEIGFRKTLVAGYIPDFSVLRHHGSFVAFEESLKTILLANGWSR